MSKDRLARLLDRHQIRPRALTPACRHVAITRGSNLAISALGAVA
jgi:hypothetical protein